jgi:phosphoglycerate dehydrogenase-like enzyme
MTRKSQKAATPWPTVVLAMVPAFTEHLFTSDWFGRLQALCDLPDATPLMTFEEPRAHELLPRADILLTSWGCPPVDVHVLQRAPRLRAIVHAAGTVKDHVTDACWERGLLVTSAAAANAVPVAEFTLAAILFANKCVFPIHQRYREVRSFQWWPAQFPRLGNFQKVVGIVGASHIGRRVIELLRPFDCRIQVSDPFLSAADAAALGVQRVDLDQLLATSDVVTLHAPALPDTHHLIDRRRLALLRDGVTLINTARGWLVDMAALEAELCAGRIAAVLDTTEPEVLPPDSPLYELANVFLTPHIAGAMGTETQRMAELALEEIARFVRGEPFRYGIRRKDLSRIA